MAVSTGQRTTDRFHPNEEPVSWRTRSSLNFPIDRRARDAEQFGEFFLRVIPGVVELEGIDRSVWCRPIWGGRGDAAR